MRQLTKLLFLCAVLLFWGRMMPTAAAPQQQTNLLTNPGFEEPYSNGYANGWAGWHKEVTKVPDCTAYYAVRPKWGLELNSDLIHGGQRSQAVGNQFDTWNGGVFQTVNNAKVGSRYRFTFWARGRASNEQHPQPSNTEVNMGVRAGIDPNGNGVWNDTDVQWSGSGSPHDTWQQFSIEAVATGTKLTLFVAADFGGANQCRAHLDMWFDDAELVEIAPPPTNTPPPAPTQPPATNTPIVPTATFTPEVTATNTPEPVPTSTATPEPPKGGKVCLNAFADDNANGFHDATEGYMGRDTLTIGQGNTIVATGLANGTATPVCFENIPSGEYQVAQIIPAGLETTTAPTTNITVQEGSTVGVEFGSRIQPTAQPPAPATEVAVNQSTPSASATTTNDPDAAADESPGTLAFAGLAVIGVAVILLGVLIFLVLRQQSR